MAHGCSVEATVVSLLMTVVHASWIGRDLLQVWLAATTDIKPEMLQPNLSESQLVSKFTANSHNRKHHQSRMCISIIKWELQLSFLRQPRPKTPRRNAAKSDSSPESARVYELMALEVFDLGTLNRIVASQDLRAKDHWTSKVSSETAQ